MSRVGNRPIPIPSGVTVNLSDDQIQVKGPKGELSCPIPARIKVAREIQLSFERPDDSKPARSNHSCAR